MFVIVIQIIMYMFLSFVCFAQIVYD